MKVKDAIKLLEAMHFDDEIIIAWWERETFSANITQDVWESRIDRVESKMDWANTHDHLELLLEGETV